MLPFCGFWLTRRSIDLCLFTISMPVNGHMRAFFFATKKGRRWAKNENLAKSNIVHSIVVVSSGRYANLYLASSGACHINFRNQIYQLNTKRLKNPVYKHDLEIELGFTKKPLQGSGQHGNWTRYVIWVIIRRVSKLVAYEIIAILNCPLVYPARSRNYLCKDIFL